MGLYRDYMGLFWGYIGIMEKKMETNILWGYKGLYGVILGYIGRMEKKMETTI